MTAGISTSMPRLHQRLPLRPPLLRRTMPPLRRWSRHRVKPHGQRTRLLRPRTRQHRRRLRSRSCRTPSALPRTSSPPRAPSARSCKPWRLQRPRQRQRQRLQRQRPPTTAGTSTWTMSRQGTPRWFPQFPATWGRCSGCCRKRRQLSRRLRGRRRRSMPPWSSFRGSRSRGTLPWSRRRRRRRRGTRLWSRRPSMPRRHWSAPTPRRHSCRRRCETRRRSFAARRQRRGRPLLQVPVRLRAGTTVGTLTLTTSRSQTPPRHPPPQRWRPRRANWCV
mmetsp:Transcript_45568/g.142974  ORF Transcript_45568/g.142974 Transcript_45568/m.142974 type:complete len:277 (+) Transcript_45568:733-1563(+)